MKKLFDTNLFDIGFSYGLFNVPALLRWATETNHHLPTKGYFDDFDFVQAELVLALIGASPFDMSTDHAQTATRAMKNLKVTEQIPSRDQLTKQFIQDGHMTLISPVALLGREVAAQWRDVFLKAIDAKELQLLDFDSLLPVEHKNATTPKVKAVTVTTPAAPIEAWRTEARKIGETICEKQPRLNIEQIASKVHNEMTKRHANKEPNMTGRGDKVPSAGSIKRHALTGLKS